MTTPSAPLGGTRVRSTFSFFANARTAGATAANGGPTPPATGQPAEAAPAAGQTPVPPDMLSETMMRNLAKYEQSRKAAQSAISSTTRVSG